MSSTIVQPSPQPAVRLGPGADLGAVLLVGDEPAIARLLVRLFTQAGIRVLPAGNLAEGLAVLERHAQDVALALVDCHGAAADCRELCGQLRARRPALRLVCAGAAADLAEPVAGAGGPTVFVRRPYLPTELVWQVHALLAGPAA